MVPRFVVSFALVLNASPPSSGFAVVSRSPAVLHPHGSPAVLQPHVLAVGARRRRRSTVSSAKTTEEDTRSFASAWWQENWARLAILTCAAVYGTNFAMVKTLDRELAPSLSASLRFGLAAFASMPILMKKTASLRQTSLLAGALEVGTVNALGYVSQAIGLQAVDASLSAFVCSLTVVVVPALDAIFLRRKTPRGTWLGVCLASVGVALLSFDSTMTDVARDAVGGRADAVAVVCTAVQPLCFGYGFWRTEQLLAKSFDDTVDASLACAAAQLAAVKAAADIWLVADLFDGQPTLPASAHDVILAVTRPDVLAAVAWTGLVTTFATVVVETVALAKISARESCLLFTTEPLWGSAFATATLDEHLGTTATLGGILIVGACMLTVLTTSRAPDPDVLTALAAESDFHGLS
ncbi:hypothetical protein CTAYLR_009377 [Chrysophaeum taylorii]|uniref:EamA domain-containing protein n=1 Tax=Chrysophaeum taylorii TaxID=2483200 RepID=A0AAD7UL45_9STRA|nr:hypothetical protein CTAYLR_009377 [Chrysophaeum taylorii]